MIQPGGTSLEFYQSFYSILCKINVSDPLINEISNGIHV